MNWLAACVLGAKCHEPSNIYKLWNFPIVRLTKHVLFQGLPIKDDGNNHDYFCALRLLMDSTVSEQYKLFPQSARTRCVKPSFQESESTVRYARWNELFIFEVPEKVMIYI
jgi:hypothetical protein